MKVFVAKKGTRYKKITKKSIYYQLNEELHTLDFIDVDFVVSGNKVVVYFTKGCSIDFIWFKKGIIKEK